MHIGSVPTATSNATSDMMRSINNFTGKSYSRNPLHRVGLTVAEVRHLAQEMEIRVRARERKENNAVSGSLKDMELDAWVLHCLRQRGHVQVRELMEFSRAGGRRISSSVERLRLNGHHIRRVLDRVFDGNGSTTRVAYEMPSADS